MVQAFVFGKSAFSRKLSEKYFVLKSKANYLTIKQTLKQIEVIEYLEKPHSKFFNQPHCHCFKKLYFGVILKKTGAIENGTMPIIKLVNDSVKERQEMWNISSLCEFELMKKNKHVFVM